VVELYAYVHRHDRIAFPHVRYVAEADLSGDGAADVFLLDYGEREGLVLLVEQDQRWRSVTGVGRNPCFLP